MTEEWRNVFPSSYPIRSSWQPFDERGFPNQMTAEDARRIVEEAKERERASWPEHTWSEIWGSEEGRE